MVDAGAKVVGQGKDERVVGQDDGTANYRQRTFGACAVACSIYLYTFPAYLSIMMPTMMLTVKPTEN